MRERLTIGGKMKGKHVPSLKGNNKFVKRFLCIFLCFVLLGLMVPNGVGAKVSALAQGNEKQELSDAKDVNNEIDQSSIPNEGQKATDKTSENLENVDNYNVHVDGDDSSNNNIVNVQAKMTLTAPGDVRFDKTGYDWPTSIEFADESPVGSGKYKTINYYIHDGETTTYGDVITFVRTTITDILVNAPDGVTFKDFNFTNKDINLNDQATENQSIEAYYSTAIVVNNDAEHSDAVLKLHDSQGETTLT